MRSEGRKTGIAWVIRNLLVAISTFVFVSFGSAAESPKWQAEWQKTIDGPRREASSRSMADKRSRIQILRPRSVKNFRSSKLSRRSGRAADMMTRIVAERRADKYLRRLDQPAGPTGRACSISIRFSIRSRRR